MAGQGVAAANRGMPLQDLDLIWDNAILYNGANTDVGKSASDLKRYSRSALKRAGLDTLDGAPPPQPRPT